MQYRTKIVTWAVGVLFLGTAVAGTGCARLSAVTASNATRLAENQYLEGRSEEDRGDLGEAEDCYEDALDYDPNHLKSLKRLAELKMQFIRYQDAAPLYARIVKVTGGTPASHADLANCYEVAGDYEAADAAYRNGLKAHPKNVRLHKNYGRMLVHQGRIDDALTHLHLVMSQSDAQYEVGRVLYNQDKKAEARRAFQRARELARKA